MGLTYLPNRFTINGVIDTKKTVMSNIENIANSSGCWVTYDAQQGHWAVVINKAETSTEASFTEDHIIGAVDYDVAGLDNLYSGVEVQYFNPDMQSSDYVRIDVAPANLLPNEQERLLKINYPLVNTSVQAELLGFRELKQSRVSGVVTFETDYTFIKDIAAGSVIDITLDLYGWDEKWFRILQIEEIDKDGAIILKVTALEYDEDVYDDSNMTYYLRSTEDGIYTQGELNAPTTPQVTKIEQGARPTILIESDTPSAGARCDAMEFWIYQMPDSEVPTWESVADEDRVYQLYRTEYPGDNFCNKFDQGQTVQIECSDLIETQLLVKTRVRNASAVSPFSASGGLVEYNPLQVTDAIGQDTDLVDENWDSLLGTLGLSTLLSLLNGFLDDNDTGPGSMWDTFLNIFDTESGGKSLTAARVESRAITTASPTVVGNILLNALAGLGTYGEYNTTNTEGNPVIFANTLSSSWDILKVEFQTPLTEMSYWAKDNTGSIVTLYADAQMAWQVSLFKDGTPVTTSTIDWNSNYGTLTVESPGAGNYELKLYPIPTYDLDMNWTGRTDPLSNPVGANWIYLIPTGSILSNMSAEWTAYSS